MSVAMERLETGIVHLMTFPKKKLQKEVPWIEDY